MVYPKIDTLYERDPQTFRVTSTLKCPEFGTVNRWLVTEKIDGDNIRLELHPDGQVTYDGRTDEAQIKATLLKVLINTLGPVQIQKAFDPGVHAVLFGEGYGAGIQKGGVYRPDPSFRLFDVAVLDPTDPTRRLWLAWESVEDIAAKLGIGTAPVLDYSATLDKAVSYVQYHSATAVQDSGLSTMHEGIVARSEPLLLTRTGQRVIWKLKIKDFTGGKR